MIVTLWATHPQAHALRAGEGVHSPFVHRVAGLRGAQCAPPPHTQHASAAFSHFLPALSRIAPEYFPYKLQRPARDIHWHVQSGQPLIEKAALRSPCWLSPDQSWQPPMLTPAGTCGRGPAVGEAVAGAAW